MKVKIKGLVFVGFAAAILSANAFATGESTVTSQAYTEATYQHKIQSGENYTGRAVVAGETAGNPTYRPITSTYTDGLDEDSPNFVTEGVVAQAIADLGGDASDAYQPKTGENSGYQIGNSAGTWAAPSAVVKETGYIDITADSTANDGSILVNIDANQIAGTKALVAAGDTKLTTGAGVKAYAQTLDEGTKYKVTKAGVWSDVGDAVDVASNSYLNRTVDSSSGALTIDANATTTGTAVGNSASGSKNLATDYAVKEYVQSVVNGITLPGMNASVCGVTAPCALVAESTGLHWRTMATDTHNGGACGDATGNCGASQQSSEPTQGD